MTVFVCSSNGESVRAITEGVFSAGADAIVFDDWRKMLEKAAAKPCHAFVVELKATISDAEEVDGYEQFASAKMGHPVLKTIPLVLISMPPGEELETFVGWEGFLAAYLRFPPDPLSIRRVLAALLEQPGGLA